MSASSDCTVKYAFSPRVRVPLRARADGARCLADSGPWPPSDVCTPLHTIPTLSGRCTRITRTWKGSSREIERDISPRSTSPGARPTTRMGSASCSPRSTRKKDVGAPRGSVRSSGWTTNSSGPRRGARASRGGGTSGGNVIGWRPPFLQVIDGVVSLLPGWVRARWLSQSRPRLLRRRRSWSMASSRRGPKRPRRRMVATHPTRVARWPLRKRRSRPIPLRIPARSYAQPLAFVGRRDRALPSRDPSCR